MKKSSIKPEVHKKSGLSSFNDNGRCDHCNGYCCSLDPVLNNCPEKYVNLLRMKNDELPLLKKLSTSTLYCIHQEGYKSTKSGCWCGIKRHVRGFDDWGYCPCAEPITEGIWQNWSQWSDCASDCSRMSVRYRACASKNPTIGFSGPLFLPLLSLIFFFRKCYWYGCSNLRRSAHRPTSVPLPKSRNNQITC